MYGTYQSKTTNELNKQGNIHALTMQNLFVLLKDLNMSIEQVHSFTSSTSMITSLKKFHKNIK